MSEMKNHSEHNEIIIAVYDGVDSAQKVLQDVRNSLASVSKVGDEAAVIMMDADGHVSVKDGHQKRKGMASGGVIGLLAGALVGLPLAGAVVGGVLGRFRAKKREHDKMTDVDEAALQDVVDKMQPNSSMIVAEVPDWRAEEVADTLQLHGAVLVLHVPVAAENSKDEEA